jgi:hypothetical protein
MVLLEEALLVSELVLEPGLAVQLVSVLLELVQEQELVVLEALEPVQVPVPVGVSLALVAPVSKMVCLDQTAVAVELVLHREELALVVDKEKE